MKTIFFIITIAMFSSQLLTAQPYGLQERAPNTSFKITFSGDTLADMELQQVFSSLTFIQPLFLTHAGDGSGRVFTVEKRGIIRVFLKNYDATESTVFLDIENLVTSRHSEGGLLGLAFHPEYELNGKFYVSYTHDNLISRISEFTVSNDPDLADLESEKVIIDVQQPSGNHNGGLICFGPDGYIYFALGDGGGSGDTYENGQNPETLLGTILRIDIDTTSGNLGYAIPSDNPFAGNNDGWREEIWAYGLRNPWRFSFDRLDSTLWCGDVGQGRWEEVDIIEKGKNYGWNIMEGFHCYPPSASCDTTGLVLPVVEYSHSLGQSITGGYVYRGTNPSLSRLYGVYIYGDYVSTRIWGLKYEDGQVKENKLIAESPASISSFGEDEDGEIYVVGYDGRFFVFKEKDGSAPTNAVPKLLSQSGLYEDISTQSVSPGIYEYSVNSPLWSDDAYKRRYLALPDTTKIDFSQSGVWEYPPEAILVKDFFLEFEKDNPDSREIVETRLLLKHANADQWSGFSYVWNDEKTDALLLDRDTTIIYTITDAQAPGGSFEQSYFYPSREQCFRCHTSVVGIVLGPKTSQMNKDHQYGAVVDNQLRSLNHIHYFSEDIGEDYTGYPQLPDPADTNHSLENRARSYLDANCSSCHVPGGPGRTNMDMRFELALDQTNMLDIPVELDDMGITNAMRIHSGEPDSSVVYLRMMDPGEHRMPPIGTVIVDETGTTLIRSWIDSMGVTSNLEHMHESQLPDKFHLSSIYPNPFNPQTTIQFEVSEASNVIIRIYDIAGRQVRNYEYVASTIGAHDIIWDATSNNGHKVSSGIYLVQIAFKSVQNGILQGRDAAKVILLK